jgi:hypothetical protein
VRNGPCLHELICILLSLFVNGCLAQLIGQ